VPPVHRFGAATIALIYAAFAVLWIVASGTLLEVATSDPVLQARIEIIKGIVFVLVSSALLYGLIRSRREALPVPPGAMLDEPGGSDVRQLVITVVLISLAVPLISLAVFALNARQVERDTTGSLQAIAASTAQHIQGWLAERHGDASTLAASRGFIRQVVELQADPQSPDRVAVLERLSALQTVFNYESVTLLDAQGDLMLTAGKPFTPDQVHLELVRAAMRAGETRMDDLRRDAEGVHLSFAVPLQREKDGRMVGVVVLRSNPDYFLFPLLSAWPLPGNTGEALLVRAEGDRVLFLNELRHGDAQALSLHLPLGDTRRAAAAALAADGPGTIAGIDYRGESVLAAWSPVGNTGWRLVAKIDRVEALRPAWVTAWWTAAVALLGVVFALLVVLQLFRQQRATQRMQLELQADRLLRHFYELPFVGMAVSEPASHRWLRYNDHLCQMFGYSVAEFAQQSWETLGHPDDAKLGVGELAGMQRGENDGFSFEKRFVRKDGSVFIGSLDVKAVRTSEGTIDHIVTTIEDVTEARRTEEALRESEERFRTLLHNVPSVAVQGYAMDGTTRYWNRASETLYGYTADEAIGRNLLDLIIPPEMRSAVREAMRRMAEYGELIPASELTLMRKDGSLVTVFSAHVAVHVPGREVEMFCIDVDLTARRQAEEALRAREAEFRMLAEATPQIVWVTLPDGEHIYFNRHWMEFTGLTLAQSLGFGWNPPFHPDDRERAARMWQQAIKSGEPYEIEYRLRRHDGVYHWMLGRALPLRDEAGNIVKWFGTCTDIDDLKRTVERLDEAQRIARMGDWECDLDTEAIRWSPQIYEILGRDRALGPPRNFAEHRALYDEQSRLKLDDVMDRVIRTGEAIDYELVMHRPDGKEVFVQAVAVPRKDEAGRIVGMFGTVQDVTVQKRNELALRSRAHQQVLVAALGRLALSDTELDEVFDAAASAVAEGLGVEFGRLLLAADDDAFDVRAGVGWAPEWLGHRVYAAMSGTHVGFVVEARGPVIIDDFRSEGRFSAAGMIARHGIISGIDVPVGHPDKPLGILGAYSRATHRFSQDDIGFVQSIANTLNTAIERARSNERLTYMVQHDALTGLPNRLLLTDRLNVAMAHAERTGKRLSLMFMDLDRFKNVNDVFGHEGGDLILQEVARRLRGAVRASDTVSRQGGDEFLVVLPEIESDEDAARVAAKLIAAVLEPYELHGTEVVLGASIGIVCFPENGREVESLLRNADVAMYAAKDQGRGRYQFYSAEMNARAHERLLLEADLRHALERGELFLDYQPQVNLVSGTVVGLEALMRWRHPERGMVPPAQFIPIAEDCGLIMAFGAWAMEVACRDHARWLAEGLLDGTMAVNVSALQFRQSDFVDTVARVIEHTGLPPDKLEIEVTESVVMRGIDEVRAKLNALDALGVKLAIDDFGTGYSSLSYLKQFPIYRLKVDQSFTRGLPDDRESAAIVQAIIGLARSLGLDVLAEGIETEAQAVLLRSMFCDAGQGYLYARPMSAEDCAAYLRAQASV
jgi:diguanylate cyclase (GGDEF)-like protein/PAS domain S-box-containing protein